VRPLKRFLDDRPQTRGNAGGRCRDRTYAPLIKSHARNEQYQRSVGILGHYSPQIISMACSRVQTKERHLDSGVRSSGRPMPRRSAAQPRADPPHACCSQGAAQGARRCHMRHAACVQVALTFACSAILLPNSCSGARPAKALGADANCRRLARTIAAPVTGAASLSRSPQHGSKGRLAWRQSAPAGGYKGARIALLVEIMAAGLTGANFSFAASSYANNDGGPPRTGQFFIGISPAIFAGSAFDGRMEALFSRLLSDQGTRLPGEKRADVRKKTAAEGITLPRRLYDELLRRL
jgi:hypothetical protein